MIDQIYFPVYERIEKEVLELSSAIHFTDEHIGVYSIHIADLIIRCSIDLESIAKDIYKRETETEAESPGKCFRWMEKHWEISKKAISIISPHFYFKAKFLPMFCPFDYKSNTDEDFYSQYNAIKHDRVKNIYKANINTLMRVLGALYILNLYYLDDKIDLRNDSLGNKMDKTKYSRIFTFHVAPYIDTMFLDSQINIDSENCIYRIIRKESYYAFKVNYKDDFDEIQSIKMVQTNDEFHEFVKSCKNKAVTIDSLAVFLSQIMNCSCENVKNVIMNFGGMKEIISVTPIKMKSTYWAILNKVNNQS